MKIFRNSAWSTWTSLFFLMPVYISFQVNKPFMGILSLAVVISSIVYHLIKPKGVDWWWKKGKKNSQIIAQSFDTLFALLLALTSFLVFIENSFSLTKVLIIILALISIFLFLHPGKNSSKHYEFFHGMWHVLSSSIVALTLLL
jgi:hypothetical protein